jgi:hypothetical protein
MAITNGYTTLQNVKDLLNPQGLATNTTDDSVIERMVEQASRLIDNICGGRTFYARTETRYFDTPADRSLFVDDDLLTITTLTNGDATTISNTEYKLHPLNDTAKVEIRLKESSTISWEADSNDNTEGVISVAGTWGYSSSAPHDIRGVCEQITVNAYKARYGQNNSGAATITAAGIMLTSDDVPRSVYAVLARYRKPVIMAID